MKAFILSRVLQAFQLARPIQSVTLVHLCFVSVPNGVFSNYSAAATPKLHKKVPSCETFSSWKTYLDLATAIHSVGVMLSDVGTLP